ncbi:unnamed protein product [Knipowitschia caucasica]
MYHVPQRFHGRNCGFLTSSQMLDHLHSPLPPLATPRDELQQQRGLTTPLQWECAVENYIILKDLAGL